MCSAESRCAGSESLQHLDPCSFDLGAKSYRAVPGRQARRRRAPDRKLRAISAGAADARLGRSRAAASSAAKTSPRRASTTARRARPAASGSSAIPAARALVVEHAHDRDLAGLGERAGGGDPDPQPGERARPDADGDQVDPLPAPGGADRLLDRAEQGPAVGRAAVRRPGPTSATRDGLGCRRSTATAVSAVAVSKPRITHTARPRSRAGRRRRAPGGPGARPRPSSSPAISGHSTKAIGIGGQVVVEQARVLAAEPGLAEPVEVEVGDRAHRPRSAARS